MESKFSLLSGSAIKRYRESGKIIIEPFNKLNLKPNSYDVTLGEMYFRENSLSEEWENNIYNIYSEEQVKKVWGDPKKALPYSYYKKKGVYLENIKDEEKIIFINPGETILGHTNEYIGGTDTVTTMMKARSSIGRNFLECCKCAGAGDLGYFNRWTMEITNNSKHYKIPLIVGRRIAQILFFDTEGLDKDDLDFKSYNEIGKYQTSNDLKTIIDNWSPYEMLPKMFKDYENF